MIARKLVYYGLVVSPSLLLGYIGLGARAYRETYEFAHFDPEQDKAAVFYTSLVKAARNLPLRVATQEDRQRARQAARVWADAVLSGKAKSIATLDIDQSTTWGVCEQITASKTQISWMVWRTAQHEIEAKNYDQAALDLATSYVVSQATKSINLFTISQSSKRQDLVLGRLAEISPYVSIAMRNRVKAYINAVRPLDVDSRKQLRLVRAELKAAEHSKAASVFKDAADLRYWQRIYTNAENSMARLDSRFPKFDSSIESRVCLRGPMPERLVRREVASKPSFLHVPRYARYAPHFAPGYGRGFPPYSVAMLAPRY